MRWPRVLCCLVLTIGTIGVAAGVGCGPQESPATHPPGQDAPGPQDDAPTVDPVGCDDNYTIYGYRPFASQAEGSQAPGMSILVIGGGLPHTTAQVYLNGEAVCSALVNSLGQYFCNFEIPPNNCGETSLLTAGGASCSEGKKIAIGCEPPPCPNGAAWPTIPANQTFSTGPASLRVTVAPMAVDYRTSCTLYRFNSRRTVPSWISSDALSAGDTQFTIALAGVQWTPGRYRAECAVGPVGAADACALGHDFVVGAPTDCSTLSLSQYVAWSGTPLHASVLMTCEPGTRVWLSSADQAISHGPEVAFWEILAGTELADFTCPPSGETTIELPASFTGGNVFALDSRNCLNRTPTTVQEGPS